MNENATSQFDEARELQWVWKSDACAAMVVAICKLALERGKVGEFSANDIDAKDRTVAGNIFHRLAHNDVLTPVGAFVGGEFVQKFVKNAGGNRIGVWRIKSAARASRLIELHAARPQPKLSQAELLPAA